MILKQSYNKCVINDVGEKQMIFKEFGNKNMPVIIFLHGGGLSWWSWKPQIKALQKE